MLEGKQEFGKKFNENNSALKLKSINFYKNNHLNIVEGRGIVNKSIWHFTPQKINTDISETKRPKTVLFF